MHHDAKEDLGRACDDRIRGFESLVTPTDFKSALLAILVAGIVAGLIVCASKALTSEITSTGKAPPVFTCCPVKPTLVEPVAPVNKT
jgi:hypothetical protein